MSRAACGAPRSAAAQSAERSAESCAGRSATPRRAAESGSVSDTAGDRRPASTRLRACERLSAATSSAPVMARIADWEDPPGSPAAARTAGDVAAARPAASRVAPRVAPKEARAPAVTARPTPKVATLTTSSSTSVNVR